MLGYVTPMDKLQGLDRQIGARRDRKLQEARERKITNLQSADSLDGTIILYEDGNKLMKWKWARWKCNPPAIAGREYDIWLWEVKDDLRLVIPHKFRTSPMPQKQIL